MVFSKWKCPLGYKKYDLISCTEMAPHKKEMADEKFDKPVLPSAFKMKCWQDLNILRDKTYRICSKITHRGEQNT